jgi:PelA/Pel-15E family pectate lyase
MESASIVRLLMSLPDPDKRVKKAVHAAMKWFDTYKLTGLRIVRTGHWGSPDRDTKLVSDPNGSPLWARYYDLKKTSLTTTSVMLIAIKYSTHVLGDSVSITMAVRVKEVTLVG